MLALNRHKSSRWQIEHQGLVVGLWVRIDTLNQPDFFVKNRMVEKQQSVQRLVLCGSTDMAIYSQAGEKLSDFAFVHFCRVALAVEEDEPLGPSDVGFFSHVAVMSSLDRLPHLIEEFWLWPD